VKQKLIIIVGPTSSGKSALGVTLAKKIGGEVISADSRQVYKGLTIGTGKITTREMQRVPHHLLDVASPKRQFTVDDFVKRANRAIGLIRTNGRIPIVVGGTGLYVDMLAGRMSYPNVPPNPALRNQLEKKSVKQLFAQLKRLDPVRAQTIEPHHKRRLIRAIEIAKGVKLQSADANAVSCQGEQKQTAADSVLWIGLNPGEKILKKKIHARLHTRLKSGMLREAKHLHAHGLTYKRMRELGLEYRFMAEVLEKKLPRAECEARLEREINRYAKRQMRWFKRNPNIHWVSSSATALRLTKQFLRS
jgi:tRNA dimethylallyltransferase